MLRDTKNNEAVIVEYGFIDNPLDLEFISNNYKELAEAVVKAVMEYKGLPYNEPVKITTNTYKVVAGDTLYGIAKKLDTTVGELKKINNLNSDILSIGQLLEIPTKSIVTGDTELYQVKKGDTLYAIASKYNISVAELKALNNLESTDLAIGQLLNVPSGLSLVNAYIVSSGDTLYGIAKKFGISVDELKEYNNLDSNLLKIGQKILIPKSKDDMTYVVQKGDTLYAIAKKFNTSTDKLIELNNLKSNIISIGQILIVKEV